MPTNAMLLPVELLERGVKLVEGCAEPMGDAVFCHDSHVLAVKWIKRVYELYCTIIIFAGFFIG